METANVLHFHDFYYLLAIEADLMRQCSIHPEYQFRHAFVKLENDVHEYKAKFAELYAENIVNYLWAACLGEARHASDMCNGGIILTELDNRNRYSVYNEAHNYPVNRENLDILLEIYSQEWRSGFGGEAWLRIIKAVNMYFTGELDAVSFIDHVVDLQHNGGSAFNKAACDATGFDTSYAGYINEFLNYKFNYDILRQYINRHFEVSTKVKKLIDRHNNIIDGKLVTTWTIGRLAAVKKSEVVYKNNILETDEIESSSNYCEYNDHMTRQDTVEIQGQAVCRTCKESYFTHCDCGDYEHDSKVIWIDGNSYCDDCASHEIYENCYDCGENHSDYIEIEGDFYCESCASKNFAFCEEHKTYYSSGNDCEQCEAETTPPTPEPLPHPTETQEKLLFKSGLKVLHLDSSLAKYDKEGLVILFTGDFSLHTGKVLKHKQSGHYSVTHKLSGTKVLETNKLGKAIAFCHSLSGKIDFSYPEGDAYYYNNAKIIKEKQADYGKKS